MTKKEILMWNKRYDGEEDLYSTGLEKELGKKFRKNKFITKDDLKKIMGWKFQGRLEGRGKHNIRELEKESELKIRTQSKCALEADEDENKVRSLTQIKRVGPAIASVILTFYDPQNYGILDIHVWRELYGKEPKGLFDKNKNYYLKVLADLRRIARQYNLTVRMVEKALFEKNKI